MTNASGNSGNRSACGVILPMGASNGVRPVVVNTSNGRVTRHPHQAGPPPACFFADGAQAIVRARPAGLGRET